MAAATRNARCENQAPGAGQSCRDPEYDEQSQRKTYLDAQLADLNTALETLEGAIKKIDRETRQRFKETFDRVNTGLQELFPRLFGGGHAYLELTGEDLLDYRRVDHGAAAGQARVEYLAACPAAKKRSVPSPWCFRSSA